MEPKILVKPDKNHNPRKGTETRPFKFLDVHESVEDKNHNPRKGTETPSFH